MYIYDVNCARPWSHVWNQLDSRLYDDSSNCRHRNNQNESRQGKQLTVQQLKKDVYKLFHSSKQRNLACQYVVKGVYKLFQSNKQRNLACQYVVNTELHKCCLCVGATSSRKTSIKRERVQGQEAVGNEGGRVLIITYKCQNDVTISHPNPNSNNPTAFNLS